VGEKAIMPDGGAWSTRAVTGATQTEIRCRITRCRWAQPEKGRAWPSRAPQSRELLGAWAPRADHRWPTRPELAAVRAEDAEECGWGARVSQKSAEKCRSGFQNQRKMWKKNRPKITPPTTRWLGHSSKKTSWDELSCQNERNNKEKQITSHHSPKRLGKSQPPLDLAGGNKSSTTLEVGRKN
jgi:hypothetical protein